MIETLITYCFIRFYGRKISAFYLVIINFIHLTSLHIYNYYNYHGQYLLGPETVCMMSVCKFSIVAFNYEDGGKPDEQIQNDYFRQKKLLERPHLLEVFSYNFFFPACLIGPSIEFHDFKQFMRLEGDYKSLNYSKCNEQLFYDIPKSLILIGITCLLGKPLNTKFTSTDIFANKNMLYKIAYIFGSVFVIRTTYYSGWSLAEIALTICGFSYIIRHEKDKEVVSFDRTDNCNVAKIENSISNSVKMQFWNRSVHLWLKNYVYIRLQKPDRSNRGFVSFITFILSAFWHGVYPSYYIFFTNMFLLEQICNYLKVFGAFDWMENDSNYFRRIFFWFVFFWMQDYGGISFTMKSIKDNINVYRAFYFVPNIVLIAGFVYVNWIGKRPSLRTR